jgi:UDP-N-acetyl-D-mannosaminuronic acid transferase (WecB/TagA/CpsF family)
MLLKNNKKNNLTRIFIKNNIVNFYGIKFYNWSYKRIIKKICKGGYLCAPAAFPLCQIFNKKNYFISLKNSTINLLDSGYFCILLRLFNNLKIKKFSGFFFLLQFLKDKRFKKNLILLIDTSTKERKLNNRLLTKYGFNNFYSYVAPFYNSTKSFQDNKLFDLINKIRPKFIIINISGLKQEYLAYVISKKIKFKLSIFCLGGAIAFVTKSQAPINLFVDRYYLGWFIRTLYNPKIFMVRIFKSILLIKFFFKSNY